MLCGETRERHRQGECLKTRRQQHENKNVSEVELLLVN